MAIYIRCRTDQFFLSLAPKTAVYLFNFFLFFQTTRCFACEEYKLPCCELKYMYWSAPDGDLLFFDRWLRWKWIWAFQNCVRLEYRLGFRVFSIFQSTHMMQINVAFGYIDRALRKLTIFIFGVVEKNYQNVSDGWGFTFFKL